MAKGLYAISGDGQHFYGEHESQAEAIAVGKTIYASAFYVAKAREPLPLSAGIDAQEILEGAQAKLDDWSCEAADFEPTEEAVAALDVLLKTAIDKWADEYGHTPYWLMLDESEPVVTVPSEEWSLERKTFQSEHITAQSADIQPIGM